MSQPLRLLVKSSSIVLLVILGSPIHTLAEEKYTPEPLNQVPSVSQLTDVQPTDWAYTALQSLIDRYGIIAGYPDGTFRGDRPLSRYEFAAALSAALARIEELAANGAYATQDDLITLQRLKDQFAIELANVRTRIDSLESRVGQLEGASFSTTTKLGVAMTMQINGAFANGDVKVEGNPIAGTNFRAAARDAVTNQPVVGRVTDNPNPTFSYVTYLFMTTSFFGSDALRTTLAAGNGSAVANHFTSAGQVNTLGTTFSEPSPVTPLNNVGLFELAYELPLSESLMVAVGPRMLKFRYFDENPYTNPLNGAGALNSYRSTIGHDPFRVGGAVAVWKIAPKFTLRLGYLVRNDDVSTPGLGLFDGSRGLTAQLDYAVSDNATLRLFYDRSTHKPPANNAVPFLLTNSARGVVDDGFGDRLHDVVGDNLVFNFDWKIAKNFALFGRYSYSSYDIKPVNTDRASGNVNLQAFHLGLAFPDLGKEGSLGTLSFIVPFDILSGNQFLVAGNGNGGQEFNIEATYFLPLNDHIALFPMLYGVFNANNFSDNPFVFGGTLRVRFFF